MGIPPLAFLQLDTMARWCAAGRLPSWTWVSATGNGDVSPAKAQGRKLWGTREVLQDLTVELKHLHFSLAMVALCNVGCGSIWWPGGLPREAYIGKNSGVLCKVSTADSIVIWLYPTRILGWTWRGDKLPFITIQPESMESRRATAKAQAHRLGERWAM
jgi:hypothetical protein